MYMFKETILFKPVVISAFLSSDENTSQSNTLFPLTQSTTKKSIKIIKNMLCLLSDM